MKQNPHYDYEITHIDHSSEMYNLLKASQHFREKMNEAPHE